LGKSGKFLGRYRQNPLTYDVVQCNGPAGFVERWLQVHALRRTAAAAALSAALLTPSVSGCSRTAADPHPFGARQTDIGQSIAAVGWNITLTNLRFDSGYALVNVDAAAADSAQHAKAADLRFGLYGALAHPIEAGVVGSCDNVPQGGALSVTSDRVSGTVCIGPITDQAQVRGVYLYSPDDRIAGTTVAYPAAFPIGLPATDVTDTGLNLSTTSVEAWRADGTELTPASLGDAAAFTGKGYMLLGLRAASSTAAYRDGAVRRGGPLMLLAGPTQPPPGLSPACSVYGASVLLLPEASLDAVRVDASLCTQGEINAALLYATVSVAGTHAAVWTIPKGGR
jgi:hypothetical protein